MGEIGAIWVTLGLKDTDLDKKLAEVQKNLTAVGDKFKTVSQVSSGLSKALGSLAGQFAIGVLAVSAFRKGMGALKTIVEDSIKGAIAEEQAENRLKTALELTGRTVAGNLGHYLKFAQAQMKFTTYTDEEVQASQALLLQLTNLNQDGIDRATKGAMGLASTMGIDLHSATMMVTKAMEGNYGALARVGIKVDENLTKEQKQATLLDQLGTLYGRATAETETFGGSLKQLSNSWDEVKETAGTAFIQMEGLGTAIVALNKAVSDFVTSGAFKSWLDQLMNSSPILRNFTDGLKLFTLVLETESAKAEHAAKVNEGMGVAIDVLGKAFSGAAPMLKIFGIDFGAIVDMFKGASEKINETGNAMEGTAKKTKSLAEQLGVTFRADTEERIKKLNEALLTYRGKLTYDEIKRISEEINALTKSMEGLKGPIIDVDTAIQRLIDGMEDLPLTAEEVARDIAASFKDTSGEIDKEWYDLLKKDIPDWMFDLWTEAEKTTVVFRTCADAVAGGFAIAFGNIALYAGNLGAAIASIVQGMTMSFSQFLTDLDTESKVVFSGFSKTANDAAISVALSFANMWLGLLADMLLSKREWDAYWDHILWEAYIAGEEIRLAISRGMMQDPNAPGWRPGEPSTGHTPRDVNPSLPGQIHPAPGNPHYAAGGIAWVPQLARIAEREPEIIMPLRQYRTASPVSAGGRSGPVIVNIKPVVIDKKDHYLIQFIQENLDHYALRVPTAAVRG